MKRKLLYTLMFSSVIFLTACAGGGGGSGASPPQNASPTSISPPPISPMLSGNSVPYRTPVRVLEHDPLVATSTDSHNSNIYTGNISSSTSEDVIIAGAMANPTGSWTNGSLAIMSWQNGTLVDKTAQWFPSDTNRIIGTLDLKIADFSNTGRNDLFVVPGTDMGYVNYAYLYTNNGSSFTRQTINLADIWSHDSVVTDLNRDGYKDIILTSYGPNTSFLFNNRAGSFTPYVQQNTVLNNTSSIAAGDFLNNGTTSLIATDPLGPGSSSKLFTWSLVNQNFNLQEVSTLPPPRFTLPKWSSYGFGNGQGASHDIRAIAKDFNNDNQTDVIVISRPWLTNGVWPNYSEIQFLKNNGGGSFSDVTDSTLVGYNTATSASYQPRFVDINNDGLEDILVSGKDMGGNTSHQFLLKTREGKFVSAYTNVLSAFTDQSFNLEKAITSSATANNNTVTLVKGPDNKLYLLTHINTTVNGDQRMAFYLSEIGTTGTIQTVQATVSAIKQTWPWMNDSQVNAVLSQSSTTWYGMNLLDPDKAMKPIGSLSIPTISSGLSAIRGYISGIDLGGSTNSVVLDSIGRSFVTDLSSMKTSNLNAFGYNTLHNDQHELTSHAEYLVNGAVVNYDGIRIGSETHNTLANGQGPSMSQQRPTQYTMGIPKIWSRKGFSYGAQYTSLNSNPWMAFGGAWGQINNSGVLDNVVAYQKNGFSARASLMYVTTNITPGLITNVSNMTGGWAETGYRFGQAKESGDMGIYAGIKPVVFSGNITANLPTSVDNSGNVQYTNKKLGIQNQASGYVRALYVNQLDKQTQYRFSAIATQTGQYRIMHELRWWIN
jgi:hypothetical protein